MLFSFCLEKICRTLRNEVKTIKHHFCYISAVVYFSADHCKGQVSTFAGINRAVIQTPSEGYPAGLHCLYLLRVSPIGLPSRTGVNFTIDKINIPVGPGGKCFDYVRIYKGALAQEANAFFPPLCGDTLPSVSSFLTEHDEVLFEFKSVHGGNAGEGVWGGYEGIERDLVKEIINGGLPTNQESVDFFSTSSCSKMSRTCIFQLIFLMGKSWVIFQIIYSYCNIRQSCFADLLFSHKSYRNKMFTDHLSLQNTSSYVSLLMAFIFVVIKMSWVK